MTKKNKIPENVTLLVKDDASSQDIHNIMKYLDACEEANKPLERVPVTPWSATDEQRKVVLDKMKELHAICKEANIPMLFIAQVAQEEDGPIFDTCKIGATDHSSRLIDIIKAVWMLMFNGEGFVHSFNPIELRNFCDNIQQLMMGRLTEQGAAESKR